ncbi:Nucleotidyltransferase [Desulfonema limicola]|uniref:Nucleotidyltransferase n=1 Tax=Desulfonema limicola TaxID=45656 RepID=A0A975B8T8_9BACT|nr:nucleotidyltransferase domain-containing protein [Desulfonema limicola]QTA81031.1 Nucleotidyltransferase [Desulfonema limicola]
MDKTDPVEQVIGKVKKYAELVRINFPVSHIILYGSYAKNTFSEDSDIDVAVIVDEIKEDFLETLAGLYKLTREIDDRIEPILLDSTHDESGFLEQIMNEGMAIYGVV